MPVVLGNGVLRRQAVNYLLRDEFTTDASAPLATPRTCEPGPGSWAITDTTSVLTISSGALQMKAKNPISNSDPWILSAVSLARVVGRTLIASLSIGSGSSLRIGYNNASTPSAVAPLTCIALENATSLRAFDNGTEIVVGTYAQGTQYTVAIVLRATGAYCFIKGGTFANWTLLWIVTNNSGVVYPAASAYGGITNPSPIDYIRVTDLPAPFSTDALKSLDVTSATQSLGSELLTNGDFNAWTADNPNSWTIIGESGSNPMVTQVDRSGGAGTGAARFFANPGNFSPDVRQNILTTGAFYESVYECTAYTSGSHALRPSSGWCGISSASTGIKKALIRAGATDLSLVANSNAVHDWTVDDASAKPLTLNAAQTIDASSIIDFTFTLPVSPVTGDQVHLCYRISASGEEFNNCWDAYLIRNDANNAWDFKVDSIASDSRTIRVNTTGVGNVTTIRAIANGNSHDWYTLASSTWVKRGSTITSALYNTAALVNTIYTSGFSFVSLVAYPVTSANYNALNNV